MFWWADLAATLSSPTRDKHDSAVFGFWALDGGEDPTTIEPEFMKFKWSKAFYAWLSESWTGKFLACDSDIMELSSPMISDSSLSSRCTTYLAPILTCSSIRVGTWWNEVSRLLASLLIVSSFSPLLLKLSAVLGNLWSFSPSSSSFSLSMLKTRSTSS